MGEGSFYLSVESLYSTDGTFALLPQITDFLNEASPLKNSHLAMVEAHSTGICGPQGCRRVALAWRTEYLRGCLLWEGLDSDRRYVCKLTAVRLISSSSLRQW
jgi:hypothetical protein